MAVIEVLTGDLEGKTFPIDTQVFSIGRNSDCDLVLPKKYISRRHAEISQQRGRFVVRGLSRKNPLFHRDRETLELTLEDGEVFEICDVRFRFRSQGARDATAPAVSGSRRRQTRFESDSGANHAGPPSGEETGVLGGGLKESGFEEDFDDDSFERGGFDDFDEPAGAESEDDTEALAREMSAVRGRNKVPEPAAAAAPAPAQPSTDGPREQFVFGAEEADSFEDDEKTGVVNLEDSAEQTGALDVLDLDAPIDDPFDKRGEGKAQQEKMFKALSIIGAASIVIAIVLVWLLNPPPDPVHRVHKPPFQLRQQQVFTTEVPYPSSDRPTHLIVDGQAVPINFASGSVKLVDDVVARVDWILPSLNNRAIFLILGRKEGTTGFTLRYSKNGDTKTFEIKVAGKSLTEEKREERLAQLVSQSKEQIKATIRGMLAAGDELWKERNSLAGEANFAKSIEKYRLAEDGVEAFKQKLRESYDPDYLSLKEEVEKKLQTALDGYKETLEKQVSLFNRMNSTGSRAQQREELEKVLEIIHDKSSYDYQRYKLFLTNYYGR